MDVTDLHNTSYYFFSTFGQVWAALVAFGGFALRDRLSGLDREREHFFEVIVERIRRLKSSVSFNVSLREFLLPSLDTFNSETTLLGWVKDRNDLIDDIKRIAVAQPMGAFTASSSNLPGEDVTSANLELHINNIRGYISGLKKAIKSRSETKQALRYLLINGLSLIIVSVICLACTAWLNSCLFYFLAMVILVWSCLTMVMIFKGFMNE